MTLRNLSFVASVMLGIGLAAPVSHSLAAPAKSLTTLTVVDSRNKVVGQATALLNARDPLLVFKGQDVVFSLYARPSGLTGTQGVLYFTSEDCAGTPYPFLEPVKPLGRPTTIFNGKVYMADPSAVEGPVVVASQFWKDRGCSATTFEPVLAPAVPVMDVPAYTPPLTVK